MSEVKVHPVPAEWKTRAYIDNDKYLAMYKRSVDDPEGFWREQANRIDWIKPFTKVKNTSFKAPDVSIKWFEDGTLNVSANCLDRHLATRGDQTAILWERDDPKAAARTHHLPASSTTRSASSPTCSRSWASRRATASPSTCR